MLPPYNLFLVTLRQPPNFSAMPSNCFRLFAIASSHLKSLVRTCIRTREVNDLAIIRIQSFSVLDIVSQRRSFNKMASCCSSTLTTRSRCTSFIIKLRRFAAKGNISTTTWFTRECRKLSFCESIRIRISSTDYHTKF